MKKTAIVFPGQGSQSVGMLAELATSHAIIQETFSEASDCIGFDIWQLTQQGPQEQLNQTENTQVAMLSADVALFRTFEKLGLAAASMMAGHSLGEYAALVCSKALNFQDAVALVAKRGRLMQASVPLGQGGMAALVGLTEEQVNLICQQSSDAKYQVTPANFNAIGQIVIAGHKNAVEKAIKLSEEMGARMAREIPVSVPCHCPLLIPAAVAFEEELAKINFRSPICSVISNVDLSVYNSQDQIRSLLKAQLYSPVRWVETIQLMKQEGIECIIECGPGKVLTGLINRIDKSLNAINVHKLQ